METKHHKTCAGVAAEEVVRGVQVLSVFNARAHLELFPPCSTMWWDKDELAPGRPGFKSQLCSSFSLCYLGYNLGHLSKSQGPRL